MFELHFQPQSRIIFTHQGVGLLHRNARIVIFVGEDLDVLMDLSDRILVLCGGQVSGIVDPRHTTKEEIGLMMTHVGQEKAGESA